jgi:GT2 family glycosyltransferase
MRRRLARERLLPEFSLALAVPADAQIEPASIVLQTVAKPEITIIIPAYGKADVTLRCLAALHRNPPTLPYEVIVVEDASGEPGADLPGQVPGVRFVANAHNEGFLRSCNAAARLAMGHYLLLLNNDTQVMPGAIDALRRTFDSHASVGLVGSRLMYPDGRQQEAGGIIWDDATSLNFGRLDHPGRSIYCYVRDADYVSGASLMIERALFEQLGGFDERYAPAYCEDSDLALRVRAAGHRVLYQPSSVVIHFEGISHGADLTQGVKAYQVRNQKLLRERWHEVLTREHFGVGGSMLRARDHARCRSVVLVVDHHVPQPDRDAGSRSMDCFIAGLQSLNCVVKLWPVDLAFDPVYVPHYQGRGVEVMYGPDFGAGFDAWMKENGTQIDTVLLSRPNVADNVLDAVRKYSRARIVYYGHDLHHRRMFDEAAVTGDARLKSEAERMLKLERSIWNRVDCVLYPSQDEADCVAEMTNRATAAISPYIFEVKVEPERPYGRCDVLFVAGFAHTPNVDAALWFCREVWPMIHEATGVTVKLVGSNPTPAVQALANAHVQVVGYVSDDALASLYDSARVAVAPLRYGAGVKSKVVEPLARGVPLVTTWVGAQGLPGVDACCAVQDDPRAFADAAIRLLRDDVEWLRSSAAERDYARDRFSRQALKSQLSEYLLCRRTQA